MVTIPRPMTAHVAALCLIGLIGSLPLPLGAAPAAEPTPTGQATPVPSVASVPAKLSLNECLLLALEHNASYKQSLVSVANAESRLRSTNQLQHATIDSDIAFSRSSQ